jgi:hypothetical protein
MIDAFTKGLVADEVLSLQHGHGSPGREERVGEVPYIKVSDLRAGLVNINPTNRVPERVAAKLWDATTSDLWAFDILSPQRTSKNIRDFCVLMLGQERVVLTKEIIVLRSGPKATFSLFYLLWALTLKRSENSGSVSSLCRPIGRTSATGGSIPRFLGRTALG